MTKQTPLRLMILVSMTSFSVSAIASLSDTQNQTAISTKSLKPSLVGIFINNQELDAIDIIYDSRVDNLITNVELADTVDNTSDALGNTSSALNSKSAMDKSSYYYLSKEDLIRLTGVVFDTPSSKMVDQTSSTIIYIIHTPIGDTQITSDQLLEYNGKQYLALNQLKKMGITASYSPADLAVNLYMGWQSKRLDNTSQSKKEDKTTVEQPIDYAPSNAGLLGLSFDSSLSASEIARHPNQPKSTSRQIYSSIGAYGYGLSGVWGTRIHGSDSDYQKQNPSSDGDIKGGNSFSQTVLDSLSSLPSDWELDNLYWAKSVEKLATRLGINQPNSLGQGVQTSGSKFTGALVAYSNRDIEHHLSYFDENSSSLLQNTSQAYQHLVGTGEPGGVAELRIDGRTIARVQIELDGRYEFLNLDVNQLNLSETLVEIAIFAYPLARQPLEVRPILLGKRRTNVATDELLIEAGIGQEGNAFNSNNNKNKDTAAHVYAEYGLSNRLAIRGGANNNLQNTSASREDDSIDWYTGLNYSPSINSNLDLSYADTPDQQLWQAQLEYRLKKFWANYQYNSRLYTDRPYISSDINTPKEDSLRNERHQLLLSYTPSNDTNLSVNQYYKELAIDNALDDYYAYASIFHRFNESLNGGLNWDTRDDRYNYRLSWNGRNARTSYDCLRDSSIGLSGDNDSDTVSLRHEANEKTSLGQSISYRHGQSDLLYQGDISYRFNDYGVDPSIRGYFSDIDSLLSLGYSLYKGQIGWEADWQLTHRNSVNFSLGYKHRYVDSITTERFDNPLIIDGLIKEESLPAWSQNNYLYARLSFDMFKAPKQNLKLGHYPRQELGSVIVEITHPAEPLIDSESMRFSLDNHTINASLLATQPNRTQYLINNIRAGDYSLTIDTKNLPLEYSTSELPSPRIHVANYTPTSVPLQLQKSYGLSGKLADAKQGSKINIYHADKLIQTTDSGNYGYFQIFGLSPATYSLQAKGYQPRTVIIDNDFVMQLVLQPSN